MVLTHNREETALMLTNLLAELLEPLTRRPPSRRKAEVFYGKVVAAARQPGFYGDGRAPDTPEGRFELVALHLFLVAERVKTTAPDGQDVARALIEAFVVDMDDCMREMGVGDLTVPKRVKRAAAGFYERSGAYRDALAASHAAVTRVTPLGWRATHLPVSPPALFCSYQPRMVSQPFWPATSGPATHTLHA